MSKDKNSDDIMTGKYGLIDPNDDSLKNDESPEEFGSPDDPSKKYGIIDSGTKSKEASDVQGGTIDMSQKYGLLDSNSPVVESPQAEAVPAPIEQPNHAPQYNEAQEAEDLDIYKDNRYLVFKLNDGVYATPILTVREVTEVPSAKPLPNTPHYFSGVTNIRGQIVSIVDLRKMFGMTPENGYQNSLIVVDTHSGPIGCIVDYIESVSCIQQDIIDQETKVENKIPGEYFLGFGKVEDDVVFIFDLKKAMNGMPIMIAA